MALIDDLYARAAGTPSDIWEHVPTLMRIGRMVDHITEFGTRRGISTAAPLKAAPRRLITYDLCRYPEVDELCEAARACATQFIFKQEAVLQTVIEPTDFLFVDTLHTCDQLTAELSLHAHRVRTFIAFHDTTTFGEYGELPDSAGLWPAIDEYFGDNPAWRLIDRWENNNGFTLFMRRQVITPA